MSNLETATTYPISAFRVFPLTVQKGYWQVHTSFDVEENFCSGCTISNNFYQPAYPRNFTFREESCVLAVLVRSNFIVKIRPELEASTLSELPPKDMEDRTPFIHVTKINYDTGQSGMNPNFYRVWKLSNGNMNS